MRLPAELILLVAEKSHSQRDVNALARVNRRTFSLLIPWLYKHNVRRHNGTGICKAAELGCLAAVKRFLAAGFDVRNGLPLVAPDRVQEFVGSTPAGDIEHPLLHAVQRGHLHLVLYLLNEGTDPDVRATSSGMTPLLVAARHGSLSIVKALTEAGAEGSCCFEAHEPRLMETIQRTPVREAAFHGHLGVVKYLLSLSNKKDRHLLASKCLPEAAASGNTGLILFLVAQEGDINYRGWFWETRHTMSSGTALAFAIMHNHAELVQVLIRHGACVDEPVRTTAGRVTTLLEKAVDLGHHQVVKVLLNYDIRSLDLRMRNAVSRGHAAVVEVLLTRYQPRPSDPWSPLDDAAMCGHIDIVRLFTGKGFDEEQALFTAVLYKRANIVDFLLEHGTNPDVPNSIRSPLRLALHYGHAPIIKAFLLFGAHIHPDDQRWFRCHSSKEIAALAEQFPIVPSYLVARQWSLCSP
ncbi:ankyrin repeat-containing domain protein [Aspergillus pseudoustus]|uniref:Ankyrin repeat-containing domain protein n=1 Tax=Aspergillus pseudoustus TaxID=1810923 RepID=A0ABR4JYC2_9EURO